MGGVLRAAAFLTVPKCMHCLSSFFLNYDTTTSNVSSTADLISFVKQATSQELRWWYISGAKNTAEKMKPQQTQ